MDETFKFIIDGLSVGLLLGANGPETTFTLQYLGYLIFLAVQNKPPPHSSPFHPFLSALSKFRCIFNIGKLISVKKIWYHNTTTPNNPPPSRSSCTKNARPTPTLIHFLESCSQTHLP
jgi:hypothetical protein